MIFSEEQTRDPNSIFSGWSRESNLFEWESKLPGLATMEFFSGSPAFSNLFASPQDGAGGASDFMQSLGRYSVFSAVRNCVSTIARGWGYFKTSVRSIRLLFKDSIETVSEVLKGLGTAMESIELAINSIAWIPIVGWIIKIIFEVCKIITSIISSVKQKQAERSQKELDKLAGQYGLPMATWSPDADSVMCQMLQQHLMPNKLDAEWAFMPRYPATSVSDFVGQRQKMNQDDSCYSGWLIYSDLIKDAAMSIGPGLGFVPGTGNIHGAVSLKTHAGGAVKDYGDFYPVTRSVASQLWSQAVKGDTGLTFALDTDKLIRAWKDYVSNAVHYGLEGIGGWTMLAGDSTAGSIVHYDEINNLKYYCSACDTGHGSCDDKLSGKNKRKDRKFSPVGHGHRNSFLAHLQKMFGWVHYHNGQALKEDDWWDTMTPVEALRNMRERQEAMIRSPKCMYLDDNTNADGTGNTRFKAINKNSALHGIWQQSVTAMFESGDWKRINYQDVIKGEDVDQAIRLKLSQGPKPTTPEKYFNMDSATGFQKGRAAMGITANAGPSILGDPEPPKPPGIVEVKTAMVRGMKLSPEGTSATGGKKSSRKKSSTLPLLIGAAAVGLLMMRGRK